MKNKLKPISVAIGFIWILFSLPSHAQNDSFFSKTDRFLKQHVYNGLVDYAAIQRQPQELQALVAAIENFDLSSLPEGDARKAFWINAYNLLVIHGIVSNYPTDSPLGIDGFFDQTKYRVAGESLTLNDIEHDKIRPVYEDARIHFVLVCAAVACPSLIAQAYFPNTLDEQLQKRTKISLNLDLHARVDDSEQKVFVSELFKWYKDDFVNDGKTIIQYINQFREKKIPEAYEVDFTPYDWRLNEFIEEEVGVTPKASDKLNSSQPRYRQFKHGLARAPLNALIGASRYLPTVKQKSRFSTGHSTHSNWYSC